MSNTYNVSIAPELAVITALNNVVGADSALNTYMRDVLGNKTDAIDDVVAANVSLMAYIKGDTQERDQRAVGKMSRVGVISTDTTEKDIVNITDKGVLTGITIHIRGSQTGNLFLKVTIDGTIVYNGYCYEGVGSVDDNPVIPFIFNNRFNTSLHIESWCQIGQTTEADIYPIYTVDV